MLICSDIFKEICQLFFAIADINFGFLPETICTVFCSHVLLRKLFQTFQTMHMCDVKLCMGTVTMYVISGISGLSPG